MTLKCTNDKKNKLINWTSSKWNTFKHQRTLSKIEKTAQRMGKKMFSNNIYDKVLYQEDINNSYHSTEIRQITKFFNWQKV